MFDISSSHIALVAAVALVVIGPKDLPQAMHQVGKWIGRARGMARHFRSGIDEIVRQAEIDEMQKKWAAENARIMAEHPLPPPEEAHDAFHAGVGPAEPPAGAAPADGGAADTHPARHPAGAPAVPPPGEGMIDPAMRPLGPAPATEFLAAAGPPSGAPEPAPSRPAAPAAGRA